MDKILLSKTLKDPNFFGSHDLVKSVDSNGEIIYREQVLTIKDIKLERIVDMEKVKSKESKGLKPEELKKDAYVLHFAEKGYKPYVIKAATVIESIEEATGTKVASNWIGKQITFYVKKNVRAFGKLTDALRVRPTAPIKKGNPIYCVDCGAEIIDAEIGGKKYTADLIAQASINNFGKIICLTCKDKPTLEDTINNLEEE